MVRFEKKISPQTFLAPMQDVTDASFMKIISGYGSPDFFVTEYLRIHEHTTLDKNFLETALCECDGKPIIAQVIGEDEYHIERVINLLYEHKSIEFLDLNLGCPAPKVYRKNVGGGLLKDRRKVVSILRTMRRAWNKNLSVKMRLGFEDDKNFVSIFEDILNEGVDFVTIHGRTVKQLYRGEAEYSNIKIACEYGKPIVANGDITSHAKARYIYEHTNCAGLMVGRHAMRNPWIFRQIDEGFTGKEIFQPKFLDVREYIQKLHDSAISVNPRIRFLDGRLKKFLNFIALGIDERGEFLMEMRKALGIKNLLDICDNYLIKGDNSEKIFPQEPFANLCPRPNHES